MSDQLTPTTEAGRALARRPFDVFTPVEDEDDPADCCHVHVGRLLDAIMDIEQEAAAQTAAAVTRFEVIDHRAVNEPGRVFVAWPCSVQLSYQDDGRTLKVFVR